MKKSVNELIKNIREYPEDWMLSEHTAKNRELRIEIWIANGFLSCRPYRVLDSDCMSLSDWSLFNRLRIWKELKGLPNYLILKAITKGKSN